MTTNTQTNGLDEWSYEENKKTYPQGHIMNVSSAEMEKFHNDFTRLKNLDKASKETYLKNRNFAFWILTALNGQTYIEATLNQIAYHVTEMIAIGTITKGSRKRVDEMVEKILPTLISKGQIERKGNMFKLTERGNEVWVAYRNANELIEIVSTSPKTRLSYCLINNLATKFYCEHNARKEARYFRESEDAETTFLETYSRLECISHYVLKEYDGFKKVTDEPMFYIEAETFMHFKKLVALKLLKSDN